MRKRACKVCGELYEPKMYWQKYCGKMCKLAAWALRKHKSKRRKP